MSTESSPQASTSAALAVLDAARCARHSPTFGLLANNRAKILGSVCHRVAVDATLSSWFMLAVSRAVGNAFRGHGEQRGAGAPRASRATRAGAAKADRGADGGRGCRAGRR